MMTGGTAERLAHEPRAARPSHWPRRLRPVASASLPSGRRRKRKEEREAGAPGPGERKQAARQELTFPA